MNVTIRNRTMEIVSNHLGMPRDHVSIASRLREDLGADSIDRIEIGMLVEDAFGIHVSDEEIEALTTIQSLTDLIEARA